MKALIVVDVQNDFVTGPLGTKEAQAAIPNIKELIRQFNNEYDLTIVTQDTHHSNYLDTLEGKKLPVEHCIHDTRGWMIVREVAQVLDELPICAFVEKETFGSFGIVGQLASEVSPVEEIHICGFCTEICVLANAVILRAAFPNVPIYIHKNACAGVTPESHEAALLMFKAQQMEVVE